MATVVVPGDRLILANGSPSFLKRGSVPFPLYTQGGNGVALSGGSTLSFQQIYQDQPWVFVVINKLSRAIASLPLCLYRMTGDGQEGEREQVRDHPLASLLCAPAPRRGAMWWKQKLAHSTLLNGNSVLAKVTPAPGAAPSGLLPLDWRYLSPQFQDNSGIVTYWETTQTGAVTKLDPSAVVHMAWESGLGDIGISPLRALAQTLNVEDAAQRYQAASFNNGVRYSAVYVLPPDADLDEDERQELRTAIQATQGGVDKAFQMALVSGGGDIKPLAHTAVEAELIDQRKLTREEIAAVYDIPPTLIGILDKATYSNVDVQSKSFYGMVLGPWLALLKETVQSQLIDAYQPWVDERLFVDWDLGEVLKGKPLEEIEAIARAIGTGVMTPNEGRQARNLPPSDDPEADKLHMPTNNMTPMSDVPVDPVPVDAASPEDVVKAHLDRVLHRVRRKGLDALDAERFRRELASDSGNDDLAVRLMDELLSAGSVDDLEAMVLGA